MKLEALLKEVLRKNGLDRPGTDPKTPVIIQSFSPDRLKILRRDFGCKLPLVYLFNSGETRLDWLRSALEFADGLGPSKARVSSRPGMVRDAHDLGMSVTVWTFRFGETGRFRDVRQEMAFFLRDLGVDALFTDYPEQFPRD